MSCAHTRRSPANPVSLPSVLRTASSPRGAEETTMRTCTGIQTKTLRSYWPSVLNCARSQSFSTTNERPPPPVPFVTVTRPTARSALGTSQPHTEKLATSRCPCAGPRGPSGSDCSTPHPRQAHTRLPLQAAQGPGGGGRHHRSCHYHQGHRVQGPRPASP